MGVFEELEKVNHMIQLRSSVHWLKDDVNIIEEFKKKYNLDDEIEAAGMAERYIDWIKDHLNPEQYKKWKTEIYNILTAKQILDKCPHCKIKMHVFSYDTSKWECPKCGLLDTRKSYFHFGEYLEEKPKQTYKHENHFTECLNHVLARGSLPKKLKLEDVLDKTRDYIIQNNIQQISLEDLRKILKTLKLAEYYKYTSYIYRELTGDGPPNISHDLVCRAKFYFKKIIKTREQIKGLGPNNPQYLYLIYKIFDIILPPHDMENRHIFHYIHLPSKATLIKREQEWKLICEKLHINL